ncbi:MAG: hypothetical protein HY675_02150 [Chloroflexi bacterium]|nr:hypothetical protein [Chloroflexota bacterium]
MQVASEAVATGATRGATLEAIRRIGLAGEALAQLRLDYERRPSPGVSRAILSKIAELEVLARALAGQDSH